MSIFQSYKSRSGKHQHFKTAHAAVLYLYINGLSNVVYISWSGSQHGTYTSISNFILREQLMLI